MNYEVWERKAKCAEFYKHFVRSNFKVKQTHPRIMVLEEDFYGPLFFLGVKK